MYLSSLTFTLLAMPVLLLLFCCVPQKGKPVFLLLAGMLLTCWNGPAGILIPAVFVCFNYGIGLLLGKLSEKRRLCLAVLLAAVTTQAAALTIIRQNRQDAAFIPIGIAITTLLGIGYLIGIYRKKYPPERNFLHLALYLTFFPVMFAGPLLSYQEFSRQLKESRPNIRCLGDGLGLFVRGLAEKVMLADTLGYVFRELRQTDPAGISMLTAWLTVMSFSMYLYFELLGYADMARGLSRCFGLELPKNFGQPFFSSSVTQFMENWNITHILWFQTNFRHLLFGRAKHRWVKYASLVLMWMLIGLWYKPSVQFLLWGMLIGLILAAELNFFKHIPDRNYAVGLVYTAISLQFSWVLFFADNMTQVLHFWRAMVGFGSGLIDKYGVYFLTSYIVLLLVCFYIATDLFRNITERISATAVGRKIASYMPLIDSVLLIFCLACMLYTDAPAELWLQL